MCRCIIMKNGRNDRYIMELGRTARLHHSIHLAWLLADEVGMEVVKLGTERIVRQRWKIDHVVSAVNKQREMNAGALKTKSMVTHKTWLPTPWVNFPDSIKCFWKPFLRCTQRCFHRNPKANKTNEYQPSPNNVYYFSLPWHHIEVVAPFIQGQQHFMKMQFLRLISTVYGV